MTPLLHRGMACAAALAALFVAGPAPAQLFQQDTEEMLKERDWREGAVPIPEYPQPERLVEFKVSAATSFRFFIDGKSLTVGQDGVVRYVLVARSPSGAQNVWFEGIRCKTGELKQYAGGRNDSTWSERRDAKWVPIEQRTVNRQHQALWREYFCPQGQSIRNSAEGIDALRRGGHPQARGEFGESPR